MRIAGSDFTFWTAEHNASCELWLGSWGNFQCETIPVTRKELEAIDLSKPGLYANSEAQDKAA